MMIAIRETMMTREAARERERREWSDQDWKEAKAPEQRREYF